MYENRKTFILAAILVVVFGIGIIFLIKSFKTNPDIPGRSDITSVDTKPSAQEASADKQVNNEVPVISGDMAHSESYVADKPEMQDEKISPAGQNELGPQDKNTITNLIVKAAGERYNLELIKQLQSLAQEEKVREFLFGCLKVEKPKEYIVILRVLELWPDERYKDVLVKSLGTDNTDILEAVLKISRNRELRDEKLVDALLKILPSYEDPDGSLIRALGAQKSEKAADPLLALLEKPESHKNRLYKHMVIESLGIIGSRKAILTLTELLKEPGTNIQYDIISALGKIAKNDPDKIAILGTEAIEAMIGFLEKDNKKFYPLISGIIKNLTGYDAGLTKDSGGGKASEAAATLRKMLGDVGRIGDYALEEELVQTRFHIKEQLMNPDAETRLDALRRLFFRPLKVCDSSVLDSLMQSYNNYGADKDGMLISAIGHAGKNDDRAVKFLEDVANDADKPNKKIVAIAAIASIDSPNAKRCLTGFISENQLARNDETVSTVVIQSLGRRKNKEALKPLMDILLSDKNNLYGVASMAIREITGDEQFPVLPLNATRDDAVRVAREWEKKLCPGK